MNKKRLSINLIARMVHFICSAGISFFITPYIVEHLSKEAYGFVGLAGNFVNYISLFVIALNGMLSRYLTVEYSKKDYEKASAYFTTALFAQIGLAVLLFVPMLLLVKHIDVVIDVPGGILSDVRLLWGLIFVSFLISIPGESFGTSAFVKNRLDISAVVQIIVKLLNSAILIIAFLFFTPKVWYMGLAAILSNIVNICINLRLKKKLLPEIKIAKTHFNFKYVKDLVVVGVWNSLNKLQQILYTGLDLLLANIFINSSEMALLSIAKTMPNQISTLISTMSGTFDPNMTIIYGKGDMKDFLKQTKFAMKFVGFVCSVPILGFVCFGKDFYSLWMPALSQAEIMKVHILAILTLMPQVFSIYIYPLYTVNTITCKLKVPVLVSIGIGLANVIIVYILLKFTNIGVYAIAGVSSVLWIFRIFLFVPTYAAHNLGMKLITFYGPLVRGVLNVGVVIAIFTIISSIVNITSWPGLIITALIAAIIGYGASMFIILDKDERLSAINLILKRKGVLKK